MSAMESHKKINVHKGERKGLAMNFRSLHAWISVKLAVFLRTTTKSSGSASNRRRRRTNDHKVKESLLIAGCPKLWPLSLQLSFKKSKFT